MLAAVVISAALAPFAAAEEPARKRDLPSIVTSLNGVDDELKAAEAALQNPLPAAREAIESRIAVLRITRDWLRLSILAENNVQYLVDGKPYDTRDDARLRAALSRDVVALEADIAATARRVRNGGAAGELAAVTLEALRLSKGNGAAASHEPSIRHSAVHLAARQSRHRLGGRREGLAN